MRFAEIHASTKRQLNEGYNDNRVHVNSSSDGEMSVQIYMNSNTFTLSGGPQKSDSIFEMYRRVTQLEKAGKISDAEVENLKNVMNGFLRDSGEHPEMNAILDACYETIKLMAQQLLLERKEKYDAFVTEFKAKYDL